MKGEVVFLYAFDVANEIATKRVTQILGRKPQPFAIRSDHTYPKDVPLYQPLAVEPDVTAALAGRPVSVLVRVYEVGVISVTMRVQFEIGGIAELHVFHNPELEGGQSLDDFARGISDKVYAELKSIMTRATRPSAPEAYTVFCITDLPGVTDVEQWLTAESRAVAGLLTETPPENLSESQVREVLRLQRSYERTDGVVVDWDAALLIDLNGYTEDELYVMELANLQLEEFRAMDRFLDTYLEQAYNDLERRRPGLFGITSRALKDLRRFRVDLTKLADEVNHITKFLGDWYLARVYLAARERFYLDRWRASVEGRLTQLDQLYNVVHSELNERRMLWLEIAIVVIFIIDIAILLLEKK